MDAIWIIFLFLLGACVGSFLNVVIWRLPRGESLVFPGSHCPKCGRAIRWYDNIPMLSWLALRGRCRFCKATISVRYLIIEAVTALLVVGLYACYFIFRLRAGAGTFAEDAWPMFAAHAALVCGLLACAAVDIELWIVPLEVTWVVAIIGVAAAAYRPHPWMPTVSPTTAAMSIAAIVGLGVAMVLMRLGYIQPSFLDADDKPAKDESKPGKPDTSRSLKVKRKGKKPPAVALSVAHGVNPRVEVLRELIFLAPAMVLAFGAWAILRYSPAAGNAWERLFNAHVHPLLAPHLGGACGAVFGYLIGGLWVWGTRILGTLGFGKEAMGMGDVHILAAVGAVTGYIVPSLAFFVAPILGLLWAIYLWLRHNQKELPYGPWLAAAAVIVMVFYDQFAGLLKEYATAMQLMTH